MNTMTLEQANACPTATALFQAMPFSGRMEPAAAARHLPVGSRVHLKTPHGEGMWSVMGHNQTDGAVQPQLGLVSGDGMPTPVAHAGHLAYHAQAVPADKVSAKVTKWGSMAFSADSFVLQMNDSGEGQPLPLVLEGLPAKDDAGNPIHYRRMTIAKCGGWVHCGTGDSIDIARQRADEWVRNTSALISAGRNPYVTRKHTFADNDAEDSLGKVIKIGRNGDSVFADVALHGDEALAIAARNGRSVGVASDGRDAKGNVHQGEWLHHLAICPNPALPDLGGMVSIAASADMPARDVPVFELAGTQPNPAPSRKGSKMKAELAQQVRAKLGIGADVTDEQIDDACATKALALSADLAAKTTDLTAKATALATLTTERDTLKTERDAAKADVTAKEQQVLSLSADLPKTSPAEISDYLETVAERREQAISSGAISQAQAGMLDGLVSDSGGNPLPLALSAHGAGADRRRFGVKFWKTIAKLAEGKDGAIRTGNAVRRDVNPAIVASGDNNEMTIEQMAVAAAKATMKQHYPSATVAAK